MAAEKIFENKVKDYLKQEGCWYIKYWGGGMFTKSGIPDLLCCVNGYFMAIELKADNGKPSPLQLHCQEEIVTAGGLSIVLYPYEFEKFKRLVQRLKQQPCNTDVAITSYAFGVRR